MTLTTAEERKRRRWRGQRPRLHLGSQEKQLHKSDLENWATRKDGSGFGITAWEETVPPEAWKRCAAGRRGTQGCSGSIEQLKRAEVAAERSSVSCSGTLRRKFPKRIWVGAAPQGSQVPCPGLLAPTTSPGTWGGRNTSGSFKSCISITQKCQLHF